jgi:uncharacterized protein YjbJ (UPF0337 family)
MADRHGVWDQIAGGWKQFRGEVRKQWADLTDDDLEYIAGERDKLEGKLQERYGIAKQEAAAQVDRFETDFHNRFPA